ncbi:MAG: penicillin-insensitive murein endopeptidase [Myxococcales bacterium]|nr:penicillin-insensitive murein endopeptidase [Myxococcales bacterium]MCB9709422.1 penicillin-insensitive murein endopeptidase [Myxococcales bacterium]
MPLRREKLPGTHIVGRGAEHLLAVCGLLHLGCLSVAPPKDAQGSWGAPSEGALLGGTALPNQGAGYVRARPDEPTRFGTERMVNALERAARIVAEHFEGTFPLKIGDLSSQEGGAHPRHGSHRSGRDADIIYYITDVKGHPHRGMGWLAFNRFGFAREQGGPQGKQGSGKTFFFDEARNWHLVRTLLSDPSIDVQWIFCSYGIKARLLSYAAIHEPDAGILFRAAWILHRPTNARSHSDHFHVRIMCSIEEHASGCLDTAPVWPWLRHRDDLRNWQADPVFGDQELISELMRDTSQR